ncbi:HNH endonuclease [Pseudonocardia sp. T1-2H]|uniref:HNH endonuclease n=1 Tax=Pseudonocardia sp. T1-2H TaxID=3128899 RepID=UPI003100ABD3
MVETDVARDWFVANEGRVVSWKELSRHEPRMVSAPKGIYKPAGDRYALTVRIMKESRYPDGKIFYDESGWRCAYHQEGSDPSRRDKEFTNRALMECLRDGISVGVLREESSTSSGVHYRVIGLANIARWLDGFFFLQSVSRSPGERDIVASVVEAEARREMTDDKDAPDDDYDARLRAERSIVARQGASHFRAALLEWYRGRCALSGSDAVPVLDAAHIVPYRGVDSNMISNGILMRTDLHTLFDKLLLCIDPDSGTVRLSANVPESAYGWIDGQRADGWGVTLGDRQIAALRRAWSRFRDEEVARGVL